MRNWVAIGAAESLAMLVPLRDEHRKCDDAELEEVAPEDFARYVQQLRGSDTTVVMVEPPHAPSMRDTFRSPIVRTSHATSVCVGWLRMTNEALRDYALRAVALHDRAGESARAIVLLAPREERYLQLLGELEGVARNASDVDVFRWTAERIRRTPMLRALRLGAGSMLFSGHGTPRGWLAYGGVSVSTLVGASEWDVDETCAAMFSLSCGTGAPVALPSHVDAQLHPAFADAVVARGVSGAAFAPLGDPLHANNRVLARALMRAMCAGHRNANLVLRDVLQRAESLHASLEGFAIVGDPEMPLRSAPGAVERGRAVFAPAVDAVLVPRGAALPNADQV